MFKQRLASLTQVLAALKSKGSFTQNLAVAFSSNMLAFIVTFIFTPIFSRIYSPEAYGLFALFNTIIVNLTVIVTLSYPNAFVLPHTERRFWDLAKLSFILTLSSCVLLLGVFGLFGVEILSFFNASSLYAYRWLIVPAVLLGAVNIIWNNWNLRSKEFKRNGLVQIGSSLGSRAVGLSYGLGIGGFTPGLLLSDFTLKFIISIASISKSIRTQFRPMWQTATWESMRSAAVEYKGYPLYQLPGTWVSVLTSQLPVLALSKFYGVAAVGQFSFANSLLNIPIQLIAFSMGPVFLQKATEIYHQDPERMPSLLRDIYLKVFYIAILPFGFLSVFGKLIFVVFLGSKWELAGVFAGYMAYYYIFYLISYFLSSLFTVINQQKYTLISHCINLLFMALAFIPGVLLHDVEWFVILFSIGSLLAFMVTTLLVFRLFKVSPVRVVLTSWLILGGVFLGLTLLRLGMEWAFPRLAV